MMISKLYLGLLLVPGSAYSMNTSKQPTVRKTPQTGRTNEMCVYLEEFECPSSDDEGDNRNAFVSIVPAAEVAEREIKRKREVAAIAWRKDAVRKVKQLEQEEEKKRLATLALVKKEEKDRKQSQFHGAIYLSGEILHNLPVKTCTSPQSFIKSRPSSTDTEQSVSLGERLSLEERMDQELVEFGRRMNSSLQTVWSFLYD